MPYKDKNKKREYNKTYRDNHKEETKVYNKVYRNSHKEKRKIYETIHRKRINTQQLKRLKINPMFRLNHNTSSAIGGSLRTNKKGAHWENLVGYTLEQIKTHLEKQFIGGMNWNNYGEWHIDHKIPRSVFNFTQPEHLDFKRCWALSNLQPMWAKENMSKSNRIYEEFQPSLLVSISNRGG